MQAPDADGTASLTPKQRRYVRNGNWMAQRSPKGGHVFSTVNRGLIRLTGWRVGGSMQGIAIGLLTTTGRRSGRPRTVPVVCLEDGSRFLVAASNTGLDSSPAWCVNLRAQPSAEIATRASRERVIAHELTDSERAEAWSRLVAYNPVLSGYQACTKRQIAVFALERPKERASS